MAPSIARTAALLLCAGGLEATYAFSPLSLAGAGTGSPAVRISSKCPAPMAAAPLPQLRKSNMILRATAKETSTTNVIQSTDENSLANRVAAAKPGDTIELEKGTYVIDGCLTIDKAITIKAAAGLTHRDVLLWGVCPEVGVTDGEDKQLLLVEGAVDRENPVKLERVSVYYEDGLPHCGGTGMWQTAINAHGALEMSKCHVSSDFGSGVHIHGERGHAIVSECRIGPCGWVPSTPLSKFGYGVIAKEGGKVQVLNSEVSLVSKTGVACSGDSATAYVNSARIGPCIVSGIASEGMGVVMKAKNLDLWECKFEPASVFGGGQIDYLDGDEWH